MSRSKVKKLLYPSFDWEIFHQKTKFRTLLSQVRPKNIPESWRKVYFKEYPRLEKIILPPAEPISEIKLQTVLENRKSTRTFSSIPITIEQISNLLYYSAGMKNNEPPYVGNRTYPSGGARYPLEIYLLSKNTELPQGVYHYNVKDHSLEVLQMKDFWHANLFNQPWINDTPLLIVITAVFERNTVKYGARGYRHILQESGHLGQNLYLLATGLGLAISGIGAYLDDELHTILDIDGVKESVIYLLGVGNSNETETG